jgi:electron transfer flavoprotein beta subunit
MLPAVVTVVKDINTPRLPSLRGKMLAKKSEIPVWCIDDIEIDSEKIGLQGSPTWVKKIFSPPQRTGGEIYEGEAEEIVESFIKALQEDKIIP